LEEFIFLEGTVPEGYIFSFTESLFNKSAHRYLQAKDNWHSYFIVNQKAKIVECAIHFHLQEGFAQSPFKATYGGFDFNDLPEEIILKFVAFIQNQLRKLGARRIFVKLPPHFIDGSKHNQIEDALIRSGFQIVSEEVSSIMEVVDQYGSEIHRSEKKRLRKSTKGNFKFEKIPISEINTIYSFILKCREKKNYSLSMSLVDMQDLATHFPNNVLLFTLKDQEKLIAASICLLVSEEVLYDFYHDHDPSYDTFSPIVMLVKGINDYCFENQIPFIDLGTSMIDDKINTGLFEFKLKLGARRAVKYSFEKNHL
jgi:hypothetical protein